MESNEDLAVASTTTPVKQFEFTGKAGEFFGIWIVNVCLTILTLGIYSAWAKVRTHQYFYGNTKLDDASFRYLANPVQILKGRIIAFVLFMAYYFAGLFSPFAAGVAILIIMLLVPALIVMSMSFRLRNSSYRNIKFNFDKNFKRAYYIFAMPVIFIGIYIFVVSLIQPGQTENMEPDPAKALVLSIFPLLIMFLFPLWEFLITQFKVVHSKFGNAELEFGAGSKDYYKMYATVILLPMLIVALIGIVAAIVAPLFKSNGGASISEEGLGLMFFPIMFAMVLFYLWMFAFLQTRRTNLIYNNIKINGHQLRSGLKVGYMMYLYFTNTLAMALTLGLAMPWAKIRTARYRAEMTSLQPVGDLGDFLNVQEQNQSALGEEIGEMFDMDLGF